MFMFEVCLIWDGELVVHKADTMLECGEWIAQYKNVPASNFRVWMGNVMIAKAMCM